ncbi:MAG: aa3-type cytochrome c oxidase subunit IV [Rhodospirillales bacterium]|jgi:hypothetical protein|nr:aa3-type cytochrome c oxidase subunit IV [Rhodospirillales bacterium]MBT4007510.1 aa3-type cytochrome c oxidase subunit IV [Rhodospirillales bacterium]MBT5075694.1 aa3-type cytochrome c oxidase subunit IV [Rhodospirillales bacterium]MBT5113224.1 aa3-type cytochrome c oxidase subunit IV [Rhodospirillales bacterium]MBT5671857.1 aa3-type cytochrome c oxidase subunit IV [Rhodospirillales bacterium]
MTRYFKEHTMAEFDDLKSHEEMWDNFVTLVTYSTIAIVATLALLFLFVA